MSQPRTTAPKKNHRKVVRPLEDPFSAVLSRESPWISDRVEMLHEIVNDERDTTADSESEGFKSILEGELGDADAAGKKWGESDCDDSTDSEEEIDHVASLDPLPVATQRRKFLRWRTKAHSASYFRVDHEVGGAMERAFTTLHVDNPTATAPELLKLYTRDYLMKERANHEIDGRRPISYHPTSILYVEQWLSGFRKRSSFAGSAGSLDLRSMEAFGSLERSLAAQPSGEPPIDATVVVHEHEELDGGPAAISAETLQEELGSRPRKRKRSSPPENVAQSSSRRGKQAGELRPQTRDFKGRKCRFCGKILRKGFNDHTYDGSTHGLCPLRDAVAEDKMKEDRNQLHQRTEAAIQQVLVSDTLKGGDKPGRKCSKCRRPYKSWLVRDGRSLNHQQFRVPGTEKKYTQVIWCPLLDSEAELDRLSAEQVQRKRDRWREANDRKKNR